MIESKLVMMEYTLFLSLLHLENQNAIKIKLKILERKRNKRKIFIFSLFMAAFSIWHNLTTFFCIFSIRRVDKFNYFSFIRFLFCAFYRHSLTITHSHNEFQNFKNKIGFFTPITVGDKLDLCVCWFSLKL